MTQTSECRQHSDNRTQQPKKYYVHKVSTNNYNILPLVGDDPTCTLKKCTTRESTTHKTPTQTKVQTQKHPPQPKVPNHPKPTTVRPLSATLQLDKRNKMLYVPLQFRAYENQGLLDTGAIQSAMSDNELRRILQAYPAAQH